MEADRKPVIKYVKDNVTVVWQPHKCIHSGVCVKGLPSVFRPQEKKWIKMDGASLEAIQEQVHRCPSGALSLGDETPAENK
jgi:uncharacterized Fe-S cluster protein YjdI